ncbi:eukaryotic translation initiation factor 4E transporter-like [Anolis carolinensis]|uniref:eukaryotic translation initiation factor 4E transporter-like n=1 Tax=Anolis carolinensis TaxID=28377 RepID=UPI002F2B22FF
MDGDRRLPHRYSKEELLDIKERPFSKRRPSCLSEKYDSEGVWDPEKWHASLYPNSGRASPNEEQPPPPPLRPKKDPEGPLGRRIGDPRERLREEDLEVVLSPQRRSFGGGCHVTAHPGGPPGGPPSSSSSAAGLAVGSRRSGSPLENGGRRIGSGRLLSATTTGTAATTTGTTHRATTSATAFEGKEPPHKEKRFRRDFGEGKRGFGGPPERRCRHDSYTEEEPEWFSGGPTSQSETIELIGFDDHILLEHHDPDHHHHHKASGGGGRKRSRRRNPSLKEGLECNGGPPPEKEGPRRGDVVPVGGPPAEQEVPPPREEFDFNEFFNLDKSVPGLASMIEDVLGEGSGSLPASSSRFSRWFSSNASHSASRSSSLRSTPHEELERLAGLSPPSGPVGGAFFAPISAEGAEGAGPVPGGGRGLGPGGVASCGEGPEVDILEMLTKAKVDLRPLLPSLSANKERLRQSTHSGVVLSVEEVEAGLKGLNVVEPHHDHHHDHGNDHGHGGPPGPRRVTDHGHGHGGGGDMSAFNRLVSSMKASGTLPAQQQHPPKGNINLDGQLMSSPETAKNILQEILGGPGNRPPPPGPAPPSSAVLSALMGGLEAAAAPSPPPRGPPPLLLLLRRLPAAPPPVPSRLRSGLPGGPGVGRRLPRDAEEPQSDGDAAGPPSGRRGGGAPLPAGPGGGHDALGPLPAGPGARPAGEALPEQAAGSGQAPRLHGPPAKPRLPAGVRHQHALPVLHAHLRDPQDVREQRQGRQGRRRREARGRTERRVRGDGGPAPGLQAPPRPRPPRGLVLAARVPEGGERRSRQEEGRSSSSSSSSSSASSASSAGVRVPGAAPLPVPGPGPAPPAAARPGPEDARPGAPPAPPAPPPPGRAAASRGGPGPSRAALLPAPRTAPPGATPPGPHAAPAPALRLRRPLGPAPGPSAPPSGPPGGRGLLLLLLLRGLLLVGALAVVRVGGPAAAAPLDAVLQGHQRGRARVPALTPDPTMTQG